MPLIIVMSYLILAPFPVGAIIGTLRPNSLLLIPVLEMLLPALGTLLAMLLATPGVLPVRVELILGKLLLACGVLFAVLCDVLFFLLRMLNPTFN